MLTFFNDNRNADGGDDRCCNVQANEFQKLRSVALYVSHYRERLTSTVFW